MNEHRRADDGWIVKVYRLWPLIVSLVAIISMAAKLRATVDDNSRTLEDHGRRIARLEDDISRVRENTDLLVQRLIKK